MLTNEAEDMSAPLLENQSATPCRAMVGYSNPVRGMKFATMQDR